MSGRAAIVHDLALENYGFGGDHPFDPLRVRLALELCEPRAARSYLSSPPAGTTMT